MSFHRKPILTEFGEKALIVLATLLFVVVLSFTLAGWIG
jgi:hypothetical protein